MTEQSTPVRQQLSDGAIHGQWWHRDEASGRIVCDLCPRACSLKDGDRGFCFVRENRDNQMVLSTYGKSTGFCVDPIEKKPLNHFLPGTSVLSFGTAGCNLGCKFCQNWDISKSREVRRLSDSATPSQIADAAADLGCQSVAYTYNDPVIWSEYAIDTARACRQRGIRSIAVTAGYITPEARGDFFREMDAANVDLKAFTEEFYHKITYSHLEPILDTLRFLRHETDCWFEITNLIIPQANDDADQLRRMCGWITEEIGCDVPVHFTAFHPDFRMTDRERTDHQTLIDAYEIAHQEGLQFVYLGNVHDVARQSTYCPECRGVLIQRDWHQLGQYNMNQDRCAACGCKIPGRFQKQPGSWGNRRQPVRISQYRPSEPSVVQIQQPNKEVAPVQQTSFSLSSSQQDQLLQAASDQIIANVTGQPVPSVRESLGELAAQPIDGIFVTLKRGEHLRGCCGMLGQTVQLGQGLSHSAARTATDDHRLPPISPTELPYLHLDVTLLGPPKPMTEKGEDRVGAIEIGKHGLRIRYGQANGLLLPSVAPENNWNARQFLDAVCRKASLPSGTWLNDDSIVELFEGHMVQGSIDTPQRVAAEIVSPSDMSQLAQLAASNINALIEGAVPMYVAPGIADGTVSGIILMATTPDGEVLQWINLSIRPGVPLQSTLFMLCQTAASEIASKRVNIKSVDVAVLWDAALHGYLGNAELEGINPAQRSIFLMDGKRAAFAFGPDSDPAKLIEQARSRERFSSAGVYSAHTAASTNQFLVSTGPRPNRGGSVRMPAVAGTFYPSDDQQLASMIDDFDVQPPAEKQQVRAAMVPHAGLRFSGQIALDVLSRIRLAADIIIIGPKHTPHGVDWAVAPNESWQITATQRMAANRSLAEQIASSVDGMQLDSTAHAKEHAIEVELPLLARLAPEARITGIAMHGGSANELTEAADSLAQLLKSLDSMPLLIISSDMNHFADESETRRRDRLALDALATLDADQLLSVCKQNDISMCGQIPAALVLKTLHAIGGEPFTATEIDYGTSAAVTGDTNRVVGYAGVTFA